MRDTLFFYQCANDSMTAVATNRAAFGDPLRCVLCHRGMKYLYALAIETDQHRQWARRGVVYNPGVGKDPEPGSLREIPE